MSGNKRNGASGAENSQVGVGIALGLALGAGFGVALDNLALGIGIGLALGVAMGAALDQKRKKGEQEGPGDAQPGDTDGTGGPPASDR